MEWYDILRIINMVSALGGLTWLVVRSGFRWPGYPYTMRLFIYALGFYAFSIAEGSLEAWLQENPLGPRIFINLFANAALLIALALSQPERGRLHGDQF